MLNIVSLLVSAAIVIWLTTRVIIVYNTTSGTRSERIFATAKQSATRWHAGAATGRRRAASRPSLGDRSPSRARAATVPS